MFVEAVNLVDTEAQNMHRDNYKHGDLATEHSPGSVVTLLKIH
jgi:hypothetical protein